MDVNTLLKLNVNGHTEKKGGLTYLSWAWAWAEAIKADPQATFEVKMFGEHLEKCYSEIGDTAMVFVTATMFGKALTCQLPVMDYRNKAIHDPNAFDVNTAIMRCMTKALSLHGLGLYIYAGEDLPEGASSLEDKIADAIRDLHAKGDEVGMYGEWESIADNEVRLAVWAMLKPDTKVRSAIKAFKEKLEPTIERS